MNGLLKPLQSAFLSRNSYGETVENRLARIDQTLQRAHRLYAIGEFAAAARLLSKLDDSTLPDELEVCVAQVDG